MKRIKSFLVTICLMLGLTARGMSRLDALSMIESGNNDHAVGRCGEISRYQTLPAVWRFYSAGKAYADPETARFVARRIMDRRIAKFYDAFSRPPTTFEFYALWNAPNQLMRGHISPAVAARCQRFANLCRYGK